MEEAAQFKQFLSVSPTNTPDFGIAAYQQSQMTSSRQWEQATPSPPPQSTSDFGSFNAATSSTPFGALAYDRSLLKDQTSYPSSQASLRSASPPTSNMPFGQPNDTPQQDEGKMSVSIDFGTSFAFTLLPQLLIAMS